ncbi:MAG TPA: hypothetical protein VFA04_16440 [Bryobacteraceae bacterium]|nr:hypothetical protein [Bryobacteraceae bacterium]
MIFQKGTEILDRTYEQVQDRDVLQGLEDCRRGLLTYRTELGPQLWKRFATERFPQHPLLPVLHQSPFSRHSYIKPRGYPGDALLLDYIYGEVAPPETTAVGHAILDWEIRRASCNSVRARRDLLTRRIDETGVRVERPRIMSIACGHLREARASRVVQERRFERFLALDQDPESIALVQRELGGHGVETMVGGVRGIIAGKIAPTEMDLVYAAGLYDYLADPIARRLTASMFGMLRPGGRLLIANFHPDLEDRAGLETTMDWWLIYRNETDVYRLMDEIPSEQIGELDLFRDEHENIVFMEITRA